jgi:hypothetical protein
MKRPRRLSGKILSAFHCACDDDELDVATSLLVLLEDIVRQSRSNSVLYIRNERDVLVAAHERLWNLRQSRQPLC